MKELRTPPLTSLKEIKNFPELKIEQWSEGFVLATLSGVKVADVKGGQAYGFIAFSEQFLELYPSLANFNCILTPQGWNLRPSQKKPSYQKHLSLPAPRPHLEATELSPDIVAHHRRYMRLALKQAREAVAAGEVPVGAVLVNAEGTVVAQGRNRVIEDHDASAHAEIVAIRAAGIALENYRLNDLTMYVTLEPCCMCTMALIHARVKTVVYGAADPRTGACGSVFALSSDTRHNHRLEVISGVCAKPCRELLLQFFQHKR